MRAGRLLSSLVVLENETDEYRSLSFPSRVKQGSGPNTTSCDKYWCCPWKFHHAEFPPLPSHTKSKNEIEGNGAPSVNSRQQSRSRSLWLDRELKSGVRLKNVVV